MIRELYEAVMIGIAVFVLIVALGSALGHIQVWCDKVPSKVDKCYLKWVP